MISKKTYTLRPRGFTLIETLVAVFILTTSIAAPLTVASRGLTTALIAKNQITAFYLAQDAVEYVRFARDTNKLLGADWMTGAGGTGTGINLSACISATGCYLDSTTQNPPTPLACAALCAPPFIATTRYLVQTSTGLFSYSATTPKVFVRKVTLTATNANEMLLTVVVYWVDVGVTRSVTISESLFNWQ